MFFALLFLLILRINSPSEFEIVAVFSPSTAMVAKTKGPFVFASVNFPLYTSYATWPCWSFFVLFAVLSNANNWEVSPIVSIKTTDAVLR